MKREREQCAPISDRTVLSTVENLLLSPLDEFPYPVKAWAKSQIFLRAKQIQIRNSNNKSGSIGKTDGAESLACGSPGLKPLPGQNLIKLGEPELGHSSPGLPWGLGQSLFDSDNARLFCVNSEIGRN